MSDILTLLNVHDPVIMAITKLDIRRRGEVVCTYMYTWVAVL